MKDKKIKIITDSTCDLPDHIIDKYDIEMIPLVFTIDGKTYFDRIDINLPEFLKKMDDSSELPKTGQINPHRFYEIYDRYLKEGYKIISIHISSKMSGTYQSALVAKDMLDTEDIEVIDSQCVCGALGALVVKAALLKEQGVDLTSIKDELLKAVEKVRSITCFESLDNLVKGGRLSKTAGVIGSFLGIKLLLSIEDGQMVVKDKVRGSKKALRNMLEYIESYKMDKKNPVILMQAAPEEENMGIYNTLKSHMEDNNIEYIECEVGCVVGTHSGRDACAVFFIEE
ncbi:MAG: DegV family protein [Clostridium argentinense]|uniref:DegV family protein n=1 Tax=Clostridium faecium TaxID=2762223 RepID=A0ABR8YVD5_9CLOT|nr:MULTISPECIES: DegV family protein [Clostridium]MBD8048243.1 DegV family protein [Clostridium faecium]MBS5823305.1 DegV family protein [Clostridium argentinense]MDU1349070.1 DegV family protein [Clostridium argentinense]